MGWPLCTCQMSRFFVAKEPRTGEEEDKLLGSGAAEKDSRLEDFLVQDALAVPQLGVGRESRLKSLPGSKEDIN